MPRARAALAAAALLAAALAAALPRSAAAADGQAVDAEVVYAESNRGLVPERFRAYGIIHYAQMVQPPEAAKGTIVFFHGCARAARAFWPFDPVQCPECMGFPEHVSHAKQALAAGYNIVVMDPSDTRHLCWSSTNNDGWTNDQPRVIGTLMQLLQRRGLNSRPVYLWGASSGGTLALKMPLWLDKYRAWAAGQAAAGVQVPPVFSVAGIISEVASPEDFGAFDSAGKLAVAAYPPTVFVRMERDGDGPTYARNAGLLRANGVPSDLVTSPVRPVGPLYFARRSPVISEAQSQAIVAGLRQIGLLGEDGLLAADPSENDKEGLPSYRWEARLRALLPWLALDSHALNINFRTSGIHQALYVAYGKHDAVSDYFTACLRWLEAGGRANLPTLLRQWTVPDGNLSALSMAAPFQPAAARRRL